jgi:hypothetical protein
LAVLVLSASLASFVVALPPRAARASIVLALDLPELVRQAEHIAVVAVSAAWDQAHERIFSTIDLKVVESWKTSASTPPAAGAHMTVVQAGGTVGDITMTVTGLGAFSPGERSVVFLRGPADHAQLVGMTQGKRPLRFHTASQRWLVAPPNLRQTKLVRPTSPGAVAPAVSTQAATSLASGGANASKELALDDFRAEVKRLLANAVPASVP